MSEPLDFEGLEAVYESLARTLDEVGEEAAPLLLTKLALLLAHRLGDAESVLRAIRAAREDL